LPQLAYEVQHDSGVDIEDISPEMTDLKSQDIQTIMNAYYELSRYRSDQLEGKLKRLEGPPKVLQLFMKAAVKRSLSSWDDLLKDWNAIEETAAFELGQKIRSSFKGDLKLIAIELARIHMISLSQPETGFVEVHNYSSHFTPLIEAGLLRVRKGDKGFKIFPPHRLLLRIYEGLVSWYSAEDICAHILASQGSKTQSGKAFEFLFAFELCLGGLSTMWEFLLSKASLSPLDYQQPLKIRRAESVEKCTDPSLVYVMIDPDRSKSKTDVIFFAQNARTKEKYRVLVRLTLQATSINQMIDEAFSDMLTLASFHDKDVKDRRLFIAPKTSAKYDSDNVTHQNLMAIGWYLFTKDSGISEAFHFSWTLMCDPSRAAEAVAIQVSKASKPTMDLEIEDVETKRRRRIMAPDTTRSSRSPEKSAPSFSSLDEFYRALQDREGLESDEVSEIKGVFEQQRIKIQRLHRLTDEKLKVYGLGARGYREAILDLVGK
jgi:hypothetical protein